MREHVFVCVGQPSVVSDHSRHGARLLGSIRRRYGRMYEIHECRLVWHGSSGRGSGGFFEWREPASSAAFALIVAPLFPFKHDTVFELGRHRSAFAVNTLMLHRRLEEEKMLDVGNITFANNPEFFQKMDWPGGGIRSALRAIGGFLC